MLLSFGANEDGQCGRHSFQSADEEDGYGNFIDTAGSPTSPLSPLRRKTSERLMNVGKIPSMVHFGNRVVVASVASGSRHTLALSSTGQVFSWGWGVQGQLGHGQNKTIMTPRRVQLLTSNGDDDADDDDNLVVTSISAGGMHSACITSEGRCYTWGASQYGQLGHGTAVVEEKTCSIPRQVMMPQKQKQTTQEQEQEQEQGGKKESSGEGGGGEGDVSPPEPEVPFIAESISLGGMHTAAVDRNGRLWCWGRADSGQTGQKEWVFTFFSGLVVPHMVSEIEEKVAMVACGGFHTAAVTQCGKVYTMGKEDFGMLGITLGSELGSDVNLVDSLLGTHIVGVSCGGWHTVMWSDEGELFVCGKGEYGRLGLGHEASVCEPVQVSLGEGIKVVSASAGGSHTLILTSHSGVYSTGRTGEGRLAIGNVNCDRVLSPTKVNLWNDHVIREDEEEDIVQVSAGGGHSSLVKGRGH